MPLHTYTSSVILPDMDNKRHYQNYVCQVMTLPKLTRSEDAKDILRKGPLPQIVEHSALNLKRTQYEGDNPAINVSKACIQYRTKMHNTLKMINNSMSSMLQESFHGIDNICNKVRHCLSDMEDHKNQLKYEKIMNLMENTESLPEDSTTTEESTEEQKIETLPKDNIVVVTKDKMETFVNVNPDNGDNNLQKKEHSRSKRKKVKMPSLLVSKLKMKYKPQSANSSNHIDKYKQYSSVEKIIEITDRIHSICNSLDCNDLDCNLDKNLEEFQENIAMLKNIVENTDKVDFDRSKVHLQSSLRRISSVLNKKSKTHKSKHRCNYVTVEKLTPSNNESDNESLFSTNSTEISGGIEIDETTSSNNTVTPTSLKSAKGSCSRIIREAKAGKSEYEVLQDISTMLDKIDEEIRNASDTVLTENMEQYRNANSSNTNTNNTIIEIMPFSDCDSLFNSVDSTSEVNTDSTTKTPVTPRKILCDNKHGIVIYEDLAIDFGHANKQANIVYLPRKRSYRSQLIDPGMYKQNRTYEACPKITKSQRLIPLLPDIYRKKGFSNLHKKMLQQLQANDSLEGFLALMERKKLYHNSDEKHSNESPKKEMRSYALQEVVRCASPVTRESKTRSKYLHQDLSKVSNKSTFKRKKSGKRFNSKKKNNEELAKKYIDSLWFSPKFASGKKELVNKICKSVEISDKPRTRSKSRNEKDVCTCNLMVQNAAPAVYSPDTCRIHWMRAKIHQTVRHRKALRVCNILDDISMKDIAPFRSEYPRRDGFVPNTGFRKVQDTYLYNMLYGKDTLNNAWDDLMSYKNTVKIKNPKRKTIKKEKEEVKVESQPLICRKMILNSRPARKKHESSLKSSSKIIGSKKSLESKKSENNKIDKSLIQNIPIPEERVICPPNTPLITNLISPAFYKNNHNIVNRVSAPSTMGLLSRPKLMNVPVTPPIPPPLNEFVNSGVMPTQFSATMNHMTNNLNNSWVLEKLLPYMQDPKPKYYRSVTVLPVKVFYDNFATYHEKQNHFRSIYPSLMEDLSAGESFASNDSNFCAINDSADEMISIKNEQIPRVFITNLNNLPREKPKIAGKPFITDLTVENAATPSIDFKKKTKPQPLVKNYSATSKKRSGSESDSKKQTKTSKNSKVCRSNSKPDSKYALNTVHPAKKTVQSARVELKDKKQKGHHTEKKNTKEYNASVRQAAILSQLESLKLRNDLIQENIQKAIDVIESKIVDILSAPDSHKNEDAFNIMEREITCVLNMMKQKTGSKPNLNFYGKISDGTESSSIQLVPEKEKNLRPKSKATHLSEKTKENKKQRPKSEKTCRAVDYTVSSSQLFDKLKNILDSEVENVNFENNALLQKFTRAKTCLDMISTSKNAKLIQPNEQTDSTSSDKLPERCVITVAQQPKGKCPIVIANKIIDAKTETEQKNKVFNNDQKKTTQSEEGKKVITFENPLNSNAKEKTSQNIIKETLKPSTFQGDIKSQIVENLNVVKTSCETMSTGTAQSMLSTLKTDGNSVSSIEFDKQIDMVIDQVDEICTKLADVEEASPVQSSDVIKHSEIVSSKTFLTPFMSAIKKLRSRSISPVKRTDEHTPDESLVTKLSSSHYNIINFLDSLSNIKEDPPVQVYLAQEVHFSQIEHFAEVYYVIQRFEQVSIEDSSQNVDEKGDSCKLVGSNRSSNFSDETDEDFYNNQASKSRKRSKNCKPNLNLKLNFSEQEIVQNSSKVHQLYPPTVRLSKSSDFSISKNENRNGNKHALNILDKKVKQIVCEFVKEIEVKEGIDVVATKNMHVKLLQSFYTAFFTLVFIALAFDYSC